MKSRKIKDFWKSKALFKIIFLVINGSNTSPLLVKELGLKRQTVHLYLMRLVEAGILKKKIDTGRAHWRKNAKFYCLNPEFYLFFLPGNKNSKKNFLMIKLTPCQEKIKIEIKSLFLYFMDNIKPILHKISTLEELFEKFKGFLQINLSYILSELKEYFNDMNFSEKKFVLHEFCFKTLVLNYDIDLDVAVFLKEGELKKVLIERYSSKRENTEKGNTH